MFPASSLTRSAMVFLDKLTFLKVCFWSGQTCSHTFCFKKAPLKKRGRFLQPLLAVAFVNTFCCARSFAFNSLAICCFSWRLTLTCLAPCLVSKCRRRSLFFNNRQSQRHTGFSPWSTNISWKFRINRLLLWHFGIICGYFSVCSLCEMPHFAVNTIARHYGKCSLWCMHDFEAT